MCRKTVLIIIYLFLLQPPVFSIGRTVVPHNINVEDKAPYIPQLLEDKLPPDTHYTCTLVPRGFIISIAESDFFEKNSAEITLQGAVLLNSMGEVLEEINNECTIEGHSEETLEPNSVYKNDWEISIARAESVLRYLINNSGICPRRIHSIGFGDIMPYAENVTKKKFTNSRINFVIFDYSVTR